MPESYTIAKVSQNVRDVKLDHGEFKSYGFTCEGHGDKVFSLLQKPESNPPKAGDSFEATVKNVFKRDDGVSVTNLKKVQQQGNGYKGGGGGKSLSEQRRIAMQASQKVAVDLVIAAETPSRSVGDLAQSVLVVAKQLYDQVEGVSA